MHVAEAMKVTLVVEKEKRLGTIVESVAITSKARSCLSIAIIGFVCE